MEGHLYRSIFRYHEEFGHWFRSNHRLRFASDEPDKASYTVTTNSVGARTHRETGDRNPSRRRALFIGCSMTAGDGVTNRCRFSDLLEEKLPWVEGHNYALSGSGNDQQFLIHRAFADKVDPQVLVLSPFTGCAGRNGHSDRITCDPLTGTLVARAKPVFSLIDGKLDLGEFPVPRLTLMSDKPMGRQKAGDAAPAGWRSGVRKMIERLSPRQWVRRNWSPLNSLYGDADDPLYQLSKAILLETLRSSNAQHKFLMPLPAAQDIRSPRRANYMEFYREVADETDAHLIDVIQSLSKLPQRQRQALFFQADGHLSELGHLFVADILADALALVKGDSGGA